MAVPVPCISTQMSVHKIPANPGHGTKIYGRFYSQTLCSHGWEPSGCVDVFSLSGLPWDFQGHWPRNVTRLTWVEPCVRSRLCRLYWLVLYSIWYIGHISVRFFRFSHCTGYLPMQGLLPEWVTAQRHLYTLVTIITRPRQLPVVGLYSWWHSMSSPNRNGSHDPGYSILANHRSPPLMVSSNHTLVMEVKLECPMDVALFGYALYVSSGWPNYWIQACTHPQSSIHLNSYHIVVK